MPEPEWSDLKFVLAVLRHGTLKEAARALGANETTVARRIRACEQQTGAALFLRGASGRYEPTDAALSVQRHAETIERAVQAIGEQVAEGVAGVVRITSVPLIVNRILAPQVGVLLRDHPLLTVELVPAAQTLDLSRREADIALRFARPEDGGLRSIVRKVGTLTFGAYAPAGGEATDWITYDDELSALPQARWLEAVMAQPGARRASLRVTDVETALEAVAAGIGRSLIPRIVGDADKRLRLFRPEGIVPPPVRDVWMVAHVDQSQRASVTAVKGWLAGLRWV